MQRYVSTHKCHTCFVLRPDSQTIRLTVRNVLNLKHRLHQHRVDNLALLRHVVGLVAVTEEHPSQQIERKWTSLLARQNLDALSKENRNRHAGIGTLMSIMSTWGALWRLIKPRGREGQARGRTGPRSAGRGFRSFWALPTPPGQTSASLPPGVEQADTGPRRPQRRPGSGALCLGLHPGESRPRAQGALSSRRPRRSVKSQNQTIKLTT